MINDNKMTGSFFAGGSAKTSPLEVEKWLNSLPYANVHHACGLIYEAMEALNREKLKPSTRKDLADLFADAHLFLVRTHLRKSLRTNLHALKYELRTAAELRAIAIEIAFAYKQIINSLQDEPDGRRKQKLSVQVMFQATRFLCHILLLSYNQYVPAPANIWKELHQLYRLAVEQGIHKQELPDEEYPANRNNSIEHTYKKILLTSLIDPYHLQYRSVWDVFDLLQEWATEARLEPMRKISGPAGFFVVDLEAETRPEPYIKFDLKPERHNLRLLDANPLVDMAHRYLGFSRDMLKEKMRIINEEPKSILLHMERTWSLPPKRYFPRSAANGELMVACGLNAVHYFLGGRKRAARPGVTQGIIVSNEDPESAVEDSAPDIYRLEPWQIVNQGFGGYSIVRQTPLAHPVRVGDLIGIVETTDTGEPAWTLGLIRWLMIPRQDEHRLGIQILSTEVSRVSIRDISEDAAGNRTETALLIDDASKPGSQALITSPGWCRPGARLAISNGGKGTFEAEYASHAETTVAFDRFSIKI